MNHKQEFNKVCRERDALKARLENAGTTNYCKDCDDLVWKRDLLMDAASQVINHRRFGIPAKFSWDHWALIPIRYFDDLSAAVESVFSGNNPKKNP